MADCFVMPSFREGLSRSIMEAMASGLPCIVSNIRGNVDLIIDKKGGFLCDVNNSKEYYIAIDTLMDDIEIRKLMSIACKDKIAEYDIKVVCNEIKNIYSQTLANGEKQHEK